MRQQAENNKLQAELNGAVVHRALSTVKQLAESAVRPVVPGKSTTEVFGEGAGYVIDRTNVKSRRVAGQT